MFQARECRWPSFARWALASSAALVVALSASAVHGAQGPGVSADVQNGLDDPETALGSGCFVDADCDDGLFCNGQEVCDNGGCISLAPPCEPQFCNESANQCSESGSHSTICSYLGDQPIEGRQDKDTFYFDATAGEALNVVVDAEAFEDSNNGGEAIVTLQGFPTGTFSPALSLSASGPLPLSFETTANFSGTFRVVIRPNPRPEMPGADPMKGDYCLTVYSSMDEANSLEAGDNVEIYSTF